MPQSKERPNDEMSTPLRALIVKDSDDDAILLARELRRGGFEPTWERVDSADRMREALDRGSWDLVLSDYTLALFSGPEALQVLQEKHLDVPFIIVSGSTSEDLVVATMHAGAHDYLPKDHMTRLSVTVERELREARLRREGREAQVALRDCEASHGAIVDAAVDGIITVDDQGLIQSFNPAAEYFFGYRAAEVIGRNVNLLMPPPYRAEHDAYIARYLRTGEKRIIGIGREVVGQRKDGQTFPIDLAISEVQIGGRRIFTGMVRDISARKQAEEALRQQRDFAESLIETAQVIVLVLDTTGGIVRFNSYMEQLSGYRLAEVRGKDWFTTLLPERNRARTRALFSQAVGDLDVRGNVDKIVTKSGEERDIEWHSRTLKDADGKVLGLLSIGDDITERRRRERRTAAQYAVTRALAESSTLREAIPRILQAICEAAEWDLGELWHVDHEANVLRWDGMWHTALAGLMEFGAVSRKAALAPGDGLPGRVWATGEPTWQRNIIEGPHFHRTAVASEAGLRGAFAFPIRSERGVIGIMAFFSRDVREPDIDLLKMLDALGRQIGDFMERKQTEAELRELQKAAQERGRLADIGAITAQIVHDVGNPLAGISMQAQLILRRAARDDRQPVSTVVRQVETIVSEAQRLDALIKEFLEFSREQRLNRRHVELPRFLRDVVSLWQPLAAAHDIALTVALPSAVPPLTADEDKLRRVFENLVKNAVEAMAPGPGRVDIRVTLPEAEKVIISVEDTGPGIPKGLHPFRLFETTKPNGTGLGLAIAKQIIQAHGGHIGFAPRQPTGTIFLIELPSRVGQQ